MVVWKTNRIWKGDRVVPGDKFYGTAKEKEALLKCNHVEVSEDNEPSMDNTKDEIKQYLESKDIEYGEYLTKAELLELL